jgi:hypothetical protein
VVTNLGNKIKKTLLAIACILVAAIAYAQNVSDSSELVTQQCKISAEAVATLKGLRYGNTAIRKDVASLIKQSLKTPENREIANKTLNLMVDDKLSDMRSLEEKYCS